MESLVDLSQAKALLRCPGSALGLHPLLLQLLVSHRLLINFSAVYISSGHEACALASLGLSCPFCRLLSPGLTCEVQVEISKVATEMVGYSQRGKFLVWKTKRKHNEISREDRLWKTPDASALVLLWTG